MKYSPPDALTTSPDAVRRLLLVFERAASARLALDEKYALSAEQRAASPSALTADDGRASEPAEERA